MPKRSIRYLFLQPALVCLHAITACNLLLTFPFASANEQRQSQDAVFTFDWVPKSQLTEKQREHVNPSCNGLYVDPFAEVEQTDPALEPIFVDAQQAEMIAGKKVFIQGDIEIQQGDRRLSAQTMHYDQNDEKASLSGTVKIRQKGLSLQGDEATVNMAGNEARFLGGQFVIHQNHMRGSAEVVEQTKDKAIILRNGEITSCEPGDNAWLLKGEKIKLEPEKQSGSGHNIQIRVAGIPIFYMPYITFPLGEERKSGLLVPTLGSTDKGIDFAQPYYWNIAPNYDATITPRYAAGHGSMLESEFRALNSLSYNELAFGFLSSDQGNGDPDLDALIEEDPSNTLATERQYKGEDRWLVSLAHQGGTDQQWYSDIEFQRASDIDYLRDLSPTSFSTTTDTYLRQAVSVGYRIPNWHFGLSIQAFQNLILDLDDSYRQSPRTIAQGRYNWSDFSLYLDHEYVSFLHRDQFYLDNSPIITGERGRATYRLNWNKLWTWGYFRPEIGVQGLSYVLVDDNLRPEADDRPSLATSFASFDTGLIFERNNGRETLEPRLFYLYRDFTDHSDLFNVTPDGQNVNFDTTPLTFSYNQLFRSYRFAGGDRLDDASRLTVGMRYRRFDNSGNNVLNLSLGQAYYFRDRKVSLNDQTDTLEESDLAVQVDAPVTSAIRVTGDMLYNPDSTQVMRGSIGFTYLDYNAREQRRIINLGYRFVREQEQTNFTIAQTIDQLDLSYWLPVDHQWNLVGRIFYDLDASKELEAFAGFEYDNCCYRMRFLARRWLDSKLATLVNDEQRRFDQGLFLELELKGLGSSGKRVEQLLRDSILGFKE